MGKQKRALESKGGDGGLRIGGRERRSDKLIAWEVEQTDTLSLCKTEENTSR